MEKDSIRVHLQWGSPEDPFDPITQITQTTVNLHATTPKGLIALEEKAPQRCFTCNEIQALIQASRCFSIVELFGSLDRKIPFNNEKVAWRMVVVLEKTG